ncbi:MAG: hypothetical protein SFV52_07610 [Saprospiraceae bacterium]|nr:hypothetical protein [Saprospiraceae bacterium]
MPALLSFDTDVVPDWRHHAEASSDSISAFLDRLLPLMGDMGNGATGLYHFCEDQPVFWLKQMRILALFKFYFWKRFLCNDPAWRIPFQENMDVLEPFHGYLRKSRQLRDAFLQAPRTECWSVGMFDKLIEQIRYTQDVGGFAAAHLPGLLLEQIEALVSNMEAQARQGANDFFANQLFATGNFLFIRKTDANFLVMLQEWPAVMIIQPSGETNHLAQRVGHLIERMQPIGGGAERERKLFFDRVRSRIVLRENP